MTEIAKHYGVRDLQIAQACDLHDIARPPAGYWQKLAYGKNVNFSAEDTVTIERSGARAPWRRTLQDAKKLGKRTMDVLVAHASKPNGDIQIVAV